jgi:hypothetical protein
MTAGEGAFCGLCPGKGGLLEVSPSSSDLPGRNACAVACGFGALAPASALSEIAAAVNTTVPSARICPKTSAMHVKMDCQLLTTTVGAITLDYGNLSLSFPCMSFTRNRCTLLGDMR